MAHICLLTESRASSGVGANMMTLAERLGVPYDDAPAFIARLVGERPEFVQIVSKVGD